MRNYRRHLGPQFSEGARLLWVELERAGLSVSDAARQLGWMRSTLSNVLYGERRPGVRLLSDIERVFGISMSTWAKEPTLAFIPPAAREPVPPDAA